jgi:hypothetical protein
MKSRMPTVQLQRLVERIDSELELAAGAVDSSAVFHSV